ncbi:neutral/alkaline non-lysosomal ceramidase N-terminal domain-containing protein [uncultured Arcticibacterium sp.]|uniref:neutral/alkaline non-lysosomal ceramidase N-terminal domain-containing protein n=1 Tax=uncultured Arcticibacterium sp. TaxID=2173042 RepID=UPI0030F8FD2D
MKILKTVSKILLGFIAFLLIVVFAMVTYIDRTPYEEMPYYKAWKQNISDLDISQTSSNDSLKVGWAKINITPKDPIPLAGYGKRRGASYSTVHDSVFVRTILLEKEGIKTALISVDLLIVPPTVSDLVKQKLGSTDLTFDHIYFGATHSHNSLGAWYNTLVGTLFAGEYDAEIEQMISGGIVNSILAAKKEMAAATVTFEKNLDTHDIRNRIVDGGKIEPFIRSLRFKTKYKTALLATYAAHSTVLNASTVALSRDYPGVLVDSLEKNSVNFAMYMAGAVGSMGPMENGETDFDEVNNQALGVMNEINSENEFESLSGNPEVLSFQISLPLRKPSPRLTTNLALRPWVFKWLFGDSPSYIKVLKIGNNLMVGMPCDFSGELMESLDNYAKTKGLNLIITSFNGTYAGYITADEHFDTETYETITMSWFGPYNGDYFSEATKDIIDLVSKN